MRKALLATLLTALPGIAAAQIVTPVPNPDTTQPSTSYAVPRVGENVDESVSAAERSSRRDARTPGPTTLRDRKDAAGAHKDRRGGAKPQPR